MFGGGGTYSTEVAERFEMSGAHLSLSHAHTPSQIFQNTLCVVGWHKQTLQPCLVCPLLICDNTGTSIGSCSGSPVHGAS